MKRPVLGHFKRFFIIRVRQVKTNPNLFCIRVLILIDSICVLISCVYRVSELVLSICYQLVVITDFINDNNS